MPGAFVPWLLHRQAMLSFGSPDALADAAGIPRELMKRIVDRGSLHRVGRSARGYLARTLEVTIRELEDLAAGKTHWIDDTRRVEWARLTPDALRIHQENSRDENRRPVRVPASRGVPVVGRILPSGAAQLLEESAWGELPRLPFRFPGAPEAFALRAEQSIGQFPAQAAIVFRGLPPGELAAGHTSLFTRSDSDGETVVCFIEAACEGFLHYRLPSAAAVLKVPLEMILRAARMIAIASQGTPSLALPWRISQVGSG